MSLVWARNTRRSTFEDALAADASVSACELLADGINDHEWLYEMQWNANIELLLAMLTAGKALILDAVGTVECWHFRMLFPDRDALTANEVCESHDLTLDIQAIRELDGASPQSVQRLRAGLTDEQVEALTIAFERGYFASYDIHVSMAIPVFEPGGHEEAPAAEQFSNDAELRIN